MSFSAAKLLALLQAHIPDGATGFVVGLSGGADSSALLAALVQLRGQNHCLPVRAIHIDHGLQAAAASFREACESLCGALGVPLSIMTVPVLAADRRVDRGGGARRALRRSRRTAAGRGVPPDGASRRGSSRNSAAAGVARRRSQRFGEHADLPGIRRGLAFAAAARRAARRFAEIRSGQGNRGRARSDERRSALRSGLPAPAAVAADRGALARGGAGARPQRRARRRGAGPSRRDRRCGSGELARWRSLVRGALAPARLGHGASTRCAAGSARQRRCRRPRRA